MTEETDGCSTCGHPAQSHKWGGANAHGKYTFLSTCRKTGCECDHYAEDGRPVRKKAGVTT